MTFNWTAREKETYFQIAEEKIMAAGFSGFLQVDRSIFGMVSNKVVKVYTLPVYRSKNMREWWAVKRALPEFKEIPQAKDQFGRKAMSIFLKGYFEIKMEVSESES